jgi:hypothetical protein
MESIVTDEGGVWYGFYHNENPATMCGETTKNYPRIGAARSQDRGATWTDLGIILESSYRSFDCDTSNQYFVGGYGDFSAILDAEHRDIYFYFSQYGRRIRQQGIALGRLAWADRDAPVGKLMVWNAGAWLPAMRGMPRGDQAESGRWKYPMASSIFETRQAWHDEDMRVDAFWGPSVHWNTYLRQYVMLMNRSKDETFAQEGIYLSFSPRLDDPAAWTAPAKILNGGAWYPQVIGTMPGVGTDTLTGQIARFFMKGISEYVIQFER